MLSQFRSVEELLVADIALVCRSARVQLVDVLLEHLLRLVGFLTEFTGKGPVT